MTEFKISTKIRKAFLVGNSNYKHLEKLKNPSIDVDLMCNFLKRRGFQVTHKKDLNRDQLEKELGAFYEHINDTVEVSLIYFSGHGLERDGVTFVLPTDIPSPKEIRWNSVRDHFSFSMDSAAEKLKKAQVRIIISDMCRSFLPEGFLMSSEERLERHEYPETIFIHSTTSGREAYEPSNKQEGSVFTKTLAKEGLNHQLSIEECCQRVINKVVCASKRKQIPWFYSSLSRTLKFSDLEPYEERKRVQVPAPAPAAPGSWVDIWGEEGICRKILAGSFGSIVWEIVPDSCKKYLSDYSFIPLCRSVDGTPIVSAITAQNTVIYANEAGKITVKNVETQKDRLLPLVSRDPVQKITLVLSNDKTIFIDISQNLEGKSRSSWKSYIDLYELNNAVASLVTSFEVEGLVYAWTSYKKSDFIVTTDKGYFYKIGIIATSEGQRAFISSGYQIYFKNKNSRNERLTDLVRNMSYSATLDKLCLVTDSKILLLSPNFPNALNISGKNIQLCHQIYLKNQKNFGDFSQCLFVDDGTYLVVGGSWSNLFVLDTRDYSLVQEINVLSLDECLVTFLVGNDYGDFWCGTKSGVVHYFCKK